MKLKTILKVGLGVLGISLIVNCSSCKKVDWEPDPYVGDHTELRIINSDGESLLCKDMKFDSYTCFNDEEIANLKNELNKVNKKN